MKCGLWSLAMRVCRVWEEGLEEGLGVGWEWDGVAGNGVWDWRRGFWDWLVSRGRRGVGVEGGFGVGDEEVTVLEGALVLALEGYEVKLRTS